MRRTEAGDDGDLENLPDPPASVVGAHPEVALRPLERRGLVRRAQLLARLDRAPAGSPILLVAPGGYGKTTLLSQWVASAAAVCAWVTADADDNDPSSLALHIALALQAALPLEARTVGLSDRLHARPRLDPADLLRAIAAIRRLGRSALLVLDDLHEIQGRSSLALVLAVIEESGSTFRVAAAGRTHPDLGLSALVADGRCLELGPAELAFSEEEARRVFVAARHAMTLDQARGVVQRTEGWPAGVYMAALVARQQPRGGPSAVRPGVISGDDVYIADYFRDELLAAEPADNVRFLLRTSVLDRMTGPLCDAVLETTGSGARLREAERRNLFVVPLDREGRSYRYHRLFREMLLSELRLREPGEELLLHRRAAAWFEGEGRPDDAITHALAGGDTPRAARLVDLRGRLAFVAGRRTAVQGWLRELDEGALADYPALAVTAGWIWALSAQPTRAQSCLRAARAARWDGPLPDGSSSLESATALLAAFLAPLGVERMLDDAGRAVELEPPGAPRRPVALTALGAAHVLTGRPDLAMPELAEAAELGRTQQQGVAALAHAELAVAALAAGHGGADDEVSASLALLEEVGLQHDVGALLTHAAAAWSAALRGDEPTTRRHVALAQQIGADASPAGLPWYAVQVSLVLGRVAVEVGEPLAARARIEEARQYLGHLLTEGVLRGQVDELADLLTRTRNTVGLPSSMALTAAEIRVLRLLPTHLSLGEIAEELRVSRNTIKTQVAATYGKLQAATRAEAVRRGQQLGLLDGADGQPDRPPGMR
jgi:LuxR family transcriptional regulator, maltose regulon positive regulatory protein